MKKIGIAIIGGTGYGAGELLRLLINHPNAEVCTVVSNSMGGEKISSVHPQLAGFYDSTFDSKVDLTKLSSYEKAVVVTALPHGVSSSFIVGAFKDLKRNNISLIAVSYTHLTLPTKRIV